MGKQQHHAIAAASFLTLAGLLSQTASATIYTWDPSQTPATPSGGTGSWNLSNVFWASAGNDFIWNNVLGDTATFAGASGGTVTITNPAVVVGNLNFTTAGYTLDLGGTTQTVTSFGQKYANGATTLTNGSLVINAAADVVLGNGTTAGSTDTIDFSGLSAFTFNNSAKNFIVRPDTTANTSNAVVFGSATSNTITAALFQVGAASGSSQGTVLTSTFRLGQTNTVNAGSMILGGFNGSGSASFQTGITTGLLTIRGTTGGTSSASTVFVGQTSSGVRDGGGVLDLTGGTIDANIGTLVINQHIAGANNAPGNSSLTMPGGTVNATEIVVGNKINSGTPQLNATFNQVGGTVTAQTLTLGRAGALTGPAGTVAGDGTATYNSVYNLSGGTLNVGNVQMIGIPGTTAAATVSATSRRLIAWSGGTLANYDASTDATINGVNGTSALLPAGIIQVAASGVGAKMLNVAPGRKLTFGANSTLTGAGVTVTKTGLGTLVLNQATPAFAPTGFTVPNNVTVDLNVTGGTVGGSATSTGAITLQPGTTLAPGNSIGTIAFGSATIGGTLAVEYQDAGGTTTDGLIDKLVVANTLDITGASVAFTDFAPTSTLNDAAYVFATYGSLTGTFAGTAPTGYTIDYAYNGNSIALVPVPEPTTLGMLGLGVATLATRRRRAAATV